VKRELPGRTRVQGAITHSGKGEVNNMRGKDNERIAQKEGKSARLDVGIRDSSYLAN